MTALHQAAQDGQVKIVSTSLAAYQGYEGYDKIAAQLLDENASINILDAQGRTPLNLAASENLFRGRHGVQDQYTTCKPGRSY